MDETGGPHDLDGPLTRALKTGASLYLDGVEEVRRENTFLTPPLTDHRCILAVEK